MHACVPLLCCLSSCKAVLSAGGEGLPCWWQALSVFALRDIDMTKIESRPLQSRPLVPLETTPGGSPKGARFNYLFHVDFVANLAEERAQHALRHLQEMAPFMRVLGCYPMHLEPSAVNAPDRAAKAGLGH